MSGQQIHRFTQKAVLSLSLIALLTVISGYFQPPQHAEGAAAHIFQLSILALVPMLVAFLATVNWKQPSGARPLALPSVILALAFGALYYLEHYRY